MKPLLLVIDLINDITHPNGKVPSTAPMVAECGVIARANQAIAEARAKKIPVVFIKVGFSEDYAECPKHSPMFSQAAKLGALKLEEWGTEFHQDLDVQPKDTIIVKHRVSALYATPLRAFLIAQGIDTVILAGVSTNMAIETTARELHDRDYRVIVLQDACAAVNSNVHQASLLSLARITQVCDVSNLSQLLVS